MKEAGRRRLLIALFLLAGTPWLVAGPGRPPDRATVELVTEMGRIVVEVDGARAPITTGNFLRYVERGEYDGGLFHRTVRDGNQPGQKVLIDVIQARAVLPLRGFPAEPLPILLERTRDTGLRHLDGTISMARDAADTATSDFFICIGDQPELDFGGRRNPDGQGFAAFGRVVEGMDVVRRIHGAPADGQALTPPILIRSARRTR